jgi:hypothetical protein
MTARPEWVSGLDFGRREAFQRALNVAGAGSVLLQTYINRTVQQLHLRELGVSAVLPRRPGQGNGAYINSRTPSSVVVSTAWVSDTDSVPEASGTYAQRSLLYRTLALRGRVTRALQAKGRSYGDVLAGEIAGRTGDYTAAYEDALVIGDNALEANQFDGLITLTQATASQIVLQTTAVAGDALTLEKLDETIDAVKGAGTREDLVIFASFKGQRLLNGLIQAQQQFNDVVEAGAGFRVRSYDRIPIVTTTAMPDVLTFDGTKVTDYSGAATTAIIVVNTRYVQIEELTPMTVMPLAKTDSQFDEFDLFGDSVLCNDNELGSAILVGIDAS